MLVSIQFLRAFASIIVVLHHIAYKDKIYGNNILNFFTFGEIGVDIFFIISGYIMMYSTHRKSVTATTFIKNRIIRIIPLYWTLTIIGLIIFLILPDKVNSSGGETVIFESFFLLPTEGKYLIQNGWTLRYEFLFYFIFMISLFLQNKRFIPIIIISLIFIGQIVDTDSTFLKFITHNLLLEFLFGIFLYFFYQRYKKDNILLSIILLILSIISLYYFMENSEIIKSRAIYYGIPALLFCASFLLLENKLQKFKRIILPLGDSSYSLYLIHPFILVGNVIVIKKFHFQSIFYDLLLIFSMLISSIIFGILTYKYIEIKQINYLKKKKA
jgi:exopolysaccharide production protein ExoZ